MTTWVAEDHWPETVAAVFEEITTEAELSAVDAARLYTACDMLAHAALLDAVIVDGGPMATGSTGNDIVNPAITEARQLRTAAAAIIGSLGAKPGRGGKTTSATARQSARTRWGSPGVAV